MIRTRKKAETANKASTPKWKLNESLELIGTNKRPRILDGHIRFSEALVAHILIGLDEKGHGDGISAYKIWKIAKTAAPTNVFSQPAIIKTLKRLVDAGLVTETSVPSKTGKTTRKRYGLSGSVDDQTQKNIRGKLKRFVERANEIQTWKDGLEECVVPLDNIHVPGNHILILGQILPLLEDDTCYNRYGLWKHVEKSMIIGMSQMAFYKIIDRLVEEEVLQFWSVGDMKAVLVSQMDTGRLQRLRKQVSEYQEIEKKYLDCYF